MKKTIVGTLIISTLALSTTLAGATDKVRPFIDLNQDGYFGPTEKVIFNNIVSDKGLRTQFSEKFGVNPDELKTALESGKTVGQFLKEKGINQADLLAEGEKALSGVVGAKLDEAFKNGKVSKEQRDRIKGEAEMRLKEFSTMMASSTTATETMKKSGFGSWVKSFWARLKSKAPAKATTTTPVVEVTATSSVK
jgi:AraC-like DNA-binding protein